MGFESKIQWTDHTFNPWWGCTKVSEACRNCYAEAVSTRFAPGVWGAKGTRRFFGDKHWNEPRKWDKKAAQAGERHRVFCGSMMDIFERLIDGHADLAAMDEARTRLWKLIQETPNLDWLLLTKRPENVALIKPPWGDVWPLNVWLGTTVEDQETADQRIPHLLSHPAAVRFLSCEPLLGPIDLKLADRAVDWIICGGESGPGARPMHPDWALSLRDQALTAGVAFHYKQWGAWAPELPAGCDIQPVVRPGYPKMYKLGKKKSGRDLDGRTWDGLPLPQVHRGDQEWLANL